MTMEFINPIIYCTGRDQQARERANILSRVIDPDHQGEAGCHYSTDPRFLI